MFSKCQKQLGKPTFSMIIQNFWLGLISLVRKLPKLEYNWNNMRGVWFKDWLLNFFYFKKDLKIKKNYYLLINFYLFVIYYINIFFCKL